MNTIPLSRFTWVKDTRTLVAEVSDFPEFGCKIPEKIMVVSDKTGKMSLFRYRNSEHDRENELLSWNYWSSAEQIKMVLFND